MTAPLSALSAATIPQFSSGDDYDDCEGERFITYLLEYKYERYEYHGVS